MTGTARQTTARKEGYLLLGDQELLNGVEGRIRQLESERVGHSLFIDEAKALSDDALVETHQGEVDKLEARLKACYARRDALKANMPKKDETPSSQ